MKNQIPNLIALVGCAAFGFGCYEIYPPVAYIICGLVLVVTAVILEIGKPKN